MDVPRTGSTFRAPVDVVEWLGNETYAYIPFEAPRRSRSSSSSWSGTWTASRCAPSWSISLDGASRIKEGEEAEIWVDTAKMHLFDPATGENLTVDREHAGRDPRPQRERRDRGRLRPRRCPAPSPHGRCRAAAFPVAGAPCGRGPALD